MFQRLLQPCQFDLTTNIVLGRNVLVSKRLGAEMSAYPDLSLVFESMKINVRKRK